MVVQPPIYAKEMSESRQTVMLIRFHHWNLIIYLKRVLILGGMLEAEFSIRGMKCWIVEISSKYNCTVTMNGCIPWQGQGGHALFTITGVGDINPLIKELKQRHDISNVEASKRGRGQIVGSVSIMDCWIIKMIIDCGCFWETAHSDGDGSFVFNVISGTGSSIPNLVKGIASKGVELNIRRIATVIDEQLITDTQEDILWLALEKGYFDLPRRTTLTEMAKIKGVSIAALSEMIKRGEKNVLRQHFETIKKISGYKVFGSSKR